MLCRRGRDSAGGFIARRRRSAYVVSFSGGGASGTRSGTQSFRGVRQMAATFKRMGWEDREVKVKRDELLAVLRENRERHVREYKAACIGYREVALRRLEESFQEAREVVNRLKEGQTVSVVG